MPRKCCTNGCSNVRKCKNDALCRMFPVPTSASYNWSSVWRIPFFCFFVLFSRSRSITNFCTQPIENRSLQSLKYVVCTVVWILKRMFLSIIYKYNLDIICTSGYSGLLIFWFAMKISDTKFKIFMDYSKTAFYLCSLLLEFQLMKTASSIMQIRYKLRHFKRAPVCDKLSQTNKKTWGSE